MDIELEECAHWKTLRSSLNKNYDYAAQWDEAISLFNTRLQRKFFNPMESLIRLNHKLGEGFSIVTVQCALIESLASFRTGQIYKLQIKTGDPTYYYSKSKHMFVDFLHTDPIFLDHFYQMDASLNKTLDLPFSADDFYDSVRCGLMHEARTKGAWHINASSYDDLEGHFIRKSGPRIKLLRTVLHYRLKTCVKQYSTDLRSLGSGKSILRRYFARKLDHLFDFLPDVNFEWWT